MDKKTRNREMEQARRVTLETLLARLGDSPTAEQLGEAVNVIAQGILSTTVGALSGLPVPTLGVGFGQGDGTIHLILYAHVKTEEMGEQVIRGFHESIPHFFVDDYPFTTTEVVRA